jgi:hypothetical protein
VSAAAAASDAAASARAAGFLASTLLKPVFTMNIYIGYIGHVRFCSSSQRDVFGKFLWSRGNNYYLWLQIFGTRPTFWRC